MCKLKCLDFKTLIVSLFPSLFLSPFSMPSDDDDDDIYSFTFTCDGTENNLTECSQSPLTTNNVIEVYITCSKSK